MVKAIYLLSTQTRANAQMQVPQPKNLCMTCIKLKDRKYCDCFKRPVNANYNRCFNHSYYEPQEQALTRTTDKDIIKYA